MRRCKPTLPIGRCVRHRPTIRVPVHCGGAPSEILNYCARGRVGKQFHQLEEMPKGTCTEFSSDPSVSGTKPNRIQKCFSDLSPIHSQPLRLLASHAYAPNHTAPSTTAATSAHNPSTNIQPSTEPRCKPFARRCHRVPAHADVASASCASHPAPAAAIRRIATHRF